ncbi:hypothetical protein CMI38_07265 [Candidatus Pacearchaeota archaeon]|nr:hypothetical protein [Candidatus Pacearchaeota archaeon]
MLKLDYMFRPNIKYMAKSFDSLKPLDILDKKQVEDLYINTELELYHERLEYVESCDNGLGKAKIKMLNDKGYWFDKFTTEEEVRDLTKSNFRIIGNRVKKFRKDVNLHKHYYSRRFESEYSLQPHYDGEKIKSTFECKIHQDFKNHDHKKYMNDDESAIYFVIPYKIIEKYMTTKNIRHPGTHNKDPDAHISSKDNPDYQRLREFIDEVESTEYEWCPQNFIPIMEKYDKKYPKVYHVHDNMIRHIDTIPLSYGKPANPLRWRFGFFPYQYVSTKDYGLIYPIFNKPGNRIFSTGSHRLLNCALSKMDIPIFVKFDKDGLIGKDVIELDTPEYFSGHSLFFEFYINDRKCIVRKTDMMIEREILQKKYERNDTVCPILEEFSYE